MSGAEFQFDVSDRLMRWYSYDITIGAGERIENTVTAPIYPSFDIDYEPPVYEYTYLLSPAKSWQSFGALDIIVNTPYYMIESGPEGFERMESGYDCHLMGLPDQELTLTLCTEAQTQAPVSQTSFLWLPTAVFFGALLVLIALWVRRVRK